jgi:hypothetical protein
MAWTDQCKIAFHTNATGRYLSQSGRKNLTKVLKELSAESGIPWKTLYRWWQDLEDLKNEINGEVVENKGNNGENSTSTPRELPLCKECGKNKVYVDKRSGKPYGEGSKGYGLCNSCRDRRYKILAENADESAEERVQCVCPECFHSFYIVNKKIGDDQ